MILIKDLGMIYPTGTSKKKARYGIYKCKCGKETKVQSSTVKNGYIKSCGCLQKEKATTHGLSRHRLYHTWNGMFKRCNNINDKSYSHYGGRGIKVCDRWNDINNFIEDMYPTFKDGLSIDRINNDGNYEPTNCRWATNETQTRNIRPMRKDNTTGYRGVFWKENRKRFVAKIKVSGKATQIGSFKNKLDAAKAYDNYVIDNNLEHTINGVCQTAKEREERG